jgi:branched-chain amino acid transport system permease protein
MTQSAMGMTARPVIDYAALLKDAALAAFVVFFLAFPLIGLQTYDQGGSLAVRGRWDLLAYAVLIGFVGRFLFQLAMLFKPVKTNKEPSDAALARQRQIGMIIRYALLGIALTMPFLPFSDRSWLDRGINVLIYVMLGWGLNIVVGLAGLLDLGYVAFYAVGAYSYALLSLNFGLNFWVCLPLAGLFAALFGILLGAPTLRLRGDYLAIVTLGFGEIIRVVLLNWGSLSGGPNGIASIPRMDFFGIVPFGNREGAFHTVLGIEYERTHQIIFTYFVILALALMTNWMVNRLRKLPLGRAWEALREDEIACKSLGMNPTNTKLSAFAIGAMLGGFAGSFFAAKQGFINPESFTFMESATILAIVVLGGMGSQMGVVFAAIFLVLLPEVTRDFEQSRMLLFGGAMILIMVWRPKGVISHREPTMRLNPVKGA